MPVQMMHVGNMPMTMGQRIMLMPMAVTGSRGYRVMVDMLMMRIVRMHVFMFHGFVGMNMLVTLIQMHPDTPSH